MVTTPILGFPDFSKQFIVETNACNSGVGVVLIQEAHTISFYSYKLSGRLSSTSIYVKKMYAITQVMDKWRHYLLGSHFLIKIDHKSLKNLLTQTIQTPEQQIFLCKLLEFDFTIYKLGKENIAVAS